MKINPTSMNKIQKIYNTQKQSQLQSKPKTGDDKINISQQAQEIKQLEETLNNTAEIREGKVKQIKNLIKNANYSVKPEKIADKILSQGQE